MRKRWIERERPILWIAFSAMGLFLALVLVDKGPPLPPFSKKFDSFDCHGVAVKNVFFEKAKAVLQLHVPESIEYPPEYLPNFIRVNARIGQANLSCEGENIVAFSRKENEMNLTYPFPFAGENQISIQCLNRMISSFERNIDESTLEWRDYSAENAYKNGLYQFRGVCMENQKILFFTKATAWHPNISFGNTTIHVEFLNTPIEKYLQEKGVGIRSENVVLIPQMPQEPTKVMLFVLPILSRIVSSRDTTFSISMPDKSTIQVTNMLHMRTPTTKPECMCFDSLRIPEIDTEISLNNDTAVKRALKAKSVLKRSNSYNKYKIVVASGMMFKLEAKIKEMCPNCTVSVLESDISGWLRKTENAGILIANHLTNILALSLMSPGSAIIDATDANYQFQWAEEYAQAHDIKYHALHEGTKYGCSDFSCYPTTPASVLTDTEVTQIIEIVRKILFE